MQQLANYGSRYYQELGFRDVSRGFAISRTGTVGLTEHSVTVPKCLHKILKLSKNSAKI